MGGQRARPPTDGRRARQRRVRRSARRIRTRLVGVRSRIGRVVRAVAACVRAGRADKRGGHGHAAGHTRHERRRRTGRSRRRAPRTHIGRTGAPVRGLHRTRPRRHPADGSPGRRARRDRGVRDESPAGRHRDRHDTPACLPRRGARPAALRRRPAATGLRGCACTRSRLGVPIRKVAPHPHLFHEPDCPLPFNFQLFAAHGFAVVDVNMRGVLGEVPATMADRMLDDVHAAVDAAVDAGFVDRGQLHLYGQSLGGWATMMLLARTPMFRSGMSSAGISDAAALYASLDARLRYETGHDTRPERFELLGKVLADNSWNIDAPPSVRPDAYHAISPVLHAARITTPLLLIHGDADYVPLEQSERMFAALTQLKRDVRLIRYWGDDHVPQSPANIADRYRRMIDWLQRA
ncbi:prolyl oligopeptidase family serine peptidase [Burkholderia cepacia]|nr:prolyl oligopeptidase family serine peptidase [Burkholderia cepacia]